MEMQLTARLLSRHSFALALEQLDWDELTKIAKEALERAQAQLTSDEQNKAQALDDNASTNGAKDSDPQTNESGNRKSRWTSFLPFSRR